MKNYKVTPWEVVGDVDYAKLIKEFGIQLIDRDLLKRIKQHTRELHPYLTRGIFFAHRDMNWILDEYEKGNRFYLYTGRGPSGSVHLGHIMPWLFTKWLQDKFGVELFFQMTDDEKFYFKNDISLKKAQELARENALDVIAMGFDPKKTFIFSDTGIAKFMYNQAALIANRITFSMIKATFGLNESSNIGKIFYTSMQTVPAIIKSVITEKNVPCLIPHAVDQDPHFRIARDILPKLNYYKPASIQCLFLPGLKQGGKMSASEGVGAIYTTDNTTTIKKKINSAFTGGCGSAKEQREKGGNPEICSVFKYLFMLFEMDDKIISKIDEECRKGERLCGQCKKNLQEKIIQFLKKHQSQRERAKEIFDQFWVEEQSDVKSLFKK